MKNQLLNTLCHDWRPEYSGLPVPVNGRKVSRHGKSRLRMSPGNENGSYLSRYII